MSTRKKLSRKTRFEVFKRDSFTCQYCGRKAPDIILEVDHIKPVSEGGTNDILNLVTSCKECNSGKSNRLLSDNTVIEKKRNQLEDLQARQEQKEMLFEWQNSLREQDEQTVQEISKFWSTLVPNSSLSENGIQYVRKLINKFSLEEILVAMRISVIQYLDYEEDNGEPTHESIELAIDKIGGICVTRRREKERPHWKELLYIRGILRNRFSYVDEVCALELLERAVNLGATIESLRKFAKTAKRWSLWRYEMENFIKGQESEDLLIEKEDD